MSFGSRPFIKQNGSNTARVTGTGAAAINLNASITQADRGGKTSIYQDGTNLSAVARQSGTNPAAASNNNSLVIVQMGSWNAANVLQSGFNHGALIEQQGIGESAVAGLIDPSAVSANAVDPDMMQIALTARSKSSAQEAFPDRT